MENSEITNLLLITTFVFAFFFLIFDVRNKQKSEIPKTNENGIRFITCEWDLIINKSNKENKLIFLYFFSSSKDNFMNIKYETFSNTSVSLFFNSNFINVMADIQNGWGYKLASNFNITFSPSFIFINQKGELIAQTHGFMLPKDLIEFGKFGLSKL